MLRFDEADEDADDEEAEELGVNGGVIIVFVSLRRESLSFISGVNDDIEEV